MSKIDVQFFKPFVDGTLKTLRTQANIEVKPGKPILKGNDTKIPYDIAGIIGIASDKIKGSIALCFSKDMFLHVISKMLGEDFKEITKDLEDGAAELLNIIFGQAKITLNEKGYSIEKAIPTVVKGSELEIRHITTGPVIILPFETEKGILYIEFSIEE